jgi:hypothetical protein
MIFKTKVLNTTVDKLLKLLDQDLYPKDWSFKESCTNNGKQTENIISLIPKEILNEILFFNNFKEKLFHIHYIEYAQGGNQELHSHINTEKYSFILYLNDSDGDTVFLVDNKKLNITPKKGTLVLFSSDIPHYALKSIKNKKVLVGAIEKNM